MSSSAATPAASSLAVKYIEPSELASLLRTEQRSKVSIIDVRDADFPYGNIVGCTNIPSTELHLNVEKYVEQHLDKDKLVFHCALSQVRGPKAANRFKNALEEIMADEEKKVAMGLVEGKLPEIYVLRGGFSKFQEEFGDAADLVENLTEEKKKAWKEGWV